MWEISWSKHGGLSRKTPIKVDPPSPMGGPWPRCVDTANSEAQAEEAEEAQLLGLEVSMAQWHRKTMGGTSPKC